MEGPNKSKQATRASTRVAAAQAPVVLAPPEMKKNPTTNVNGPTKRKKKKKASGKENGKFKMAYTNRRVTRQMSRSATNELSKGELSVLSDEEKLQLTSWGLPASVIAKYKSKGVTSLFPWQLDCLGNEKVLEGRNLLYSAPTSAGKTLVAEILMVKRVLELGKKAIMILPFVSVCREKMFSLQEIFGDAGVRVEGFMGSYNPPGGFKAVDIAICTIEKANSLINKLLEEKSISQLGTIVVDELHLIGDPHRGYLLELLLTKIKFMMSKQILEDVTMSENQDESKESKKLNIQIIGMSATLPNLELLSTWIDGELVISNYRPVPLLERIIFDNKIYDQSIQLVRDVKLETLNVQNCPEGDDSLMLYLSLETILAGHSVLIFCPSKAKCEGLARFIAQSFYNIGSKFDLDNDVGLGLRKQLNSEKIKDMLAQLKQCPAGIDEVLSKTVAFGVAFHHAGLTYDERDIIEASFKRGVLRVIVATQTLSAGVNLPARRVIVSTPWFNGGLLDVLTYRQMCGRAGRKGVDTEGKMESDADAEGESILICGKNASAKEKGIQLVQSSLPYVKSALLGHQGSLSSSMKRAVLEVVASGIATLPADVIQYSKCTLLSRSIDLGLYDNDNDVPPSQESKNQTIEECLQFLVENDFIRLQHYENESRSDEYMPTQLGSACLASSLAPDEGIVVFKELLKARQHFVLDTELHVVYQVTPIYLSDQLRNIPWRSYFDIYTALTEEETKVAARVGVKESFLLQAMIGTVSKDNIKFKEDFMVHHRFYAALALNDLVNEKSITSVCEKYGLDKGVIQALQQSASTFAGMVTAFTNRLGWFNLELLVSQFQERLQFGVQRELCDLVRLSTMNAQRARVLYDNGIKSVAELAASDPAEVEKNLHRAGPFLSAVHGAGQTNQGQRNVWVIGKGEGLSESEAAQQIVEEARQFIQIELGLPGDVQFGPPGSHTSLSQKLTKEDLVDEIQSSDESTDKEDVLKEEENENILLVNDKCTESSEVPLVEILRGGEKIAFTDHSVPATQQKSKAVEVKNPNISYDMFDDSFVIGSQDVFEDIEAPNSKENCDPLQRRNDGKRQAECSLQEEELMELSGHMKEIINELTETSINTSEREQNKTPKHKHRRKTPSDSGTIKHSTPVTDACITNFKKRLSAITPGGVIGDGQNEETPDKKVLNGTWDMDEELLAELNKDFDSVASLMEVSLNMNDEQNPVCKSPVLEIQFLGNNKIINESFPKLNDSDAAAMQAMVDDSKAFGSEDLFAEFDIPNTSTPSPPINNGIINGRNNNSNLPEVAVPRTLHFAPNEDPESSIESDTDLFESSTETCWTSGQSSARNSTPNEPILTTTIGGQTIKVMKVFAPEFIPHDMFDPTKPVGIGMKLVPPKRPSSTARSGIGARIVSPKPTGRVVGEEEREHSITLYNGGNTIWVYQWKHCENQMIRNGRMHPFLNIQGKLGDLFTRLRDSGAPMVLLDSKEKLKKLLTYFGKDLITKLPISSNIWNPKIAQWMLQFNEDNCNISTEKLVDIHLDAGKKKITSLGWSREIVNSFISYYIIESLKKKLEDCKLWKHFTDTEMPSIMPIMLMEMNGLGMDSTELSRMKKVLQFQSALLEVRAFELAGRQFSLSSPKEIRQVLFREIGLKQPSKTKGTGKDVLSRLDHELPQLIIEWRKITSALQKVVIPFQQEKNLETGRVHGIYSHFTVTGRVVMSDPSLQCVPRDFDLTLDFSPEEIEDIKENCRIKFGTKLGSLLNQIDKGICASQSMKAGVSLISMRNVFVPCCQEFVILAADYSQLELRILAHLSQDKGLLTALNRKGGDVFIAIASQWKKLPADQITSSMRQEAKGIVYGVIYGMGAKTLSEQMEVDEADAARFITEFMKAYPGIRVYLDNTIKTCQKLGYIETISGRRRYLSCINSKNPSQRAQAERQAVNSQIQGSASDLVKKAMTNIHSRICQLFPDSFIPVDWKPPSKSSFNPTNIPKVTCFPILNLHDELIFEVRKSNLLQIAYEIRNQMESSLKLTVRLPVVIKQGNSWGSLEVLEEKVL